MSCADKLAAVRRVEGARGGMPGRGLGKLIRSLRVLTDDHAPHKYDDVRLVLDAMPNLEDARFQWVLDGDTVPIFAFSESKKLRHLILTSIPLDVSFPSICRPTFHNLVALSLVEVEVDPIKIVELLTPVSFPSLRRLRFCHSHDLDKDSFFPDLSRALFYRLDALEVYIDDLPVIPMWVTQQCRVPVVIDVYDTPTFEMPHESRCSYLLLVSPHLDQPDPSVSLEMVDEIIRTFRAFNDLIHRSPGTLFALYLPAEVDDSVHPFPNHRTWLHLKLARAKLVQTCQAHDVRVVYRSRDDRTSSPFMLPGLSASFVADRDNVLEDLRRRARLTGVGDDHEVYELEGSSGEEDSEEDEDWGGGEEDSEEDERSERGEEAGQGTEETERMAASRAAAALIMRDLQTLNIKLHPDGTHEMVGPRLSPEETMAALRAARGLQ